MIEFPDKLQALFEPCRYKVLYGGRGGSKSWGIARALLVMGASRPLRIFCGREIQKSIKDSVHKLLGDQIRAIGLDGFYEVLQSEIRGKNGTEFLFAGLKHNINNIKSLESVDIAWIEEAQTVTKSSWDVLIPTIRKEGSEIWVSFNPGLEEDETYQRFVKKPPANATLIDIGWRDNPWFPEVLRAEKDDLKARDPDAYLHVWEGKCKQVLDGAIFANELRAAMEQDRITRVLYDASKPVRPVFDLGWADNTSIWFSQSVGNEFRLIDCYQNRGHRIQHYIEILQKRGYFYDAIYLPHDAANENLTAERTVEGVMKAAFPNCNVVVLPRLGLKDGIDAARTIFGQFRFDADKCADGLMALRHYRYEIDSDTGKFGKNPEHDWSSHFADALRYLAVSIRQEEKARPKPQRYSGNWMS